jgi:hypothetical protein
MLINEHSGEDEPHESQSSRLAILEDPLFSPENLRRIAERQRAEDEEDLSDPSKTFVHGQTIDLSAAFGIDETLVFPISFNTRQLNCDMQLSGNIVLKLKASLKDFQDAYRIQNRTDRILKLREILRFEATIGQLMFS